MKKYPQQDPLTHEWFWNGKWYDYYPKDEVDNYNEAYDRYMEDKLERKRQGDI